MIDTPDLKDIIDLLSVPKIRKSLLCELAQYRHNEKTAREINQFNELLEFYKEIVYYSQTRKITFDKNNEPVKVGVSNPFHWFELLRARDKPEKWIQYYIEPEPDPLDGENFIPGDIIRDMASRPVSEMESYMLSKQPSQEREGEFSATFKRPSEYLIVGSIEKHHNPRAIRREVYDYTDDELLAYKTMFHYMERDRSVKEYLFKEFFYKVKPLVDGARKNAAHPEEMDTIFDGE